MFVRVSARWYAELGPPPVSDWEARTSPATLREGDGSGEVRGGTERSWGGLGDLGDARTWKARKSSERWESPAKSIPPRGPPDAVASRLEAHARHRGGVISASGEISQLEHMRDAQAAVRRVQGCSGR